MERAYDNAVVLRDELSSRTLSYIQLALDCMEKHAGSGAFAYDLQPVLDDLFAFWGCLDDNVEDEECRNIIKCGKYLERLDLYMRLDYPYRMIEKEYNKFLNRLHKIRIHYNLSEIDTFNEIMNLGDGWRDRDDDRRGSHAWTEVWDGQFWHGLDPTHNCLVDERYIKLSHGRDFMDAAVDRGCFLGTASQQQTILIKVEEK